MKIVKGTVTINFTVELDVEDISEDAMTLYESDCLIAKAINDQMPSGFWVERDIFTTSNYDK